MYVGPKTPLQIWRYLGAHRTCWYLSASFWTFLTCIGRLDVQSPLPYTYLLFLSAWWGTWRLTAFRSRFYSHHSLIAIHLEKNNGSKKCAIDRRWRSQSRRPFWAWNSSWRRDCSFHCCNKLLLFWPPSTAVKGGPRSCFCFRRPRVEVTFEIVQLIRGMVNDVLCIASDSNAAFP